MKVSWLWPESEVMGMSCFEFQFGGSTVYIISMYRFALVLRVLISSHFHCHFYKYSITYALRNWYCILLINKNSILCAVFMNQLNMQVRLPCPGLFLTIITMIQHGAARFVCHVFVCLNEAKSRTGSLSDFHQELDPTLLNSSISLSLQM